MGSHDIDVAMREAFGPDVQKLHIHGDCAADDGDEEGVGRYSESFRSPETSKILLNTSSAAYWVDLSCLRRALVPHWICLYRRRHTVAAAGLAHVVSGALYCCNIFLCASLKACRWLLQD